MSFVILSKLWIFCIPLFLPSLLSDCTIKFGSGVQVYTVADKILRDNLDVAYKDDQFLYVCKTPGDYLQDINSNGLSGAFAIVTCDGTTLLYNNEPVRDGVDCGQATQPYCLFSDTPPLTEFVFPYTLGGLNPMTFPYYQIRSAGEGVPFVVRCAGQGSWLTFEATCGTQGWTTNIDPSTECPKAEKGCPLADVTPLFKFPGSEEFYSHQTILFTTCHNPQRTAIELECSEGSYHIRENGELGPQISLLSTALACGMIEELGPSGDCNLDVDASVKALSAPSGVEREPGSALLVGDRLIFLCQANYHILDDVFNDLSKRGYLEVECTANGLESDGRLVKNGLACELSPYHQICLQNELPAKVSLVDTNPLFEVIMLGQIFNATCSGSGAWYTLSVECKGTHWAVFKDAVEITNAVSETCAAAEQSCDAFQYSEMVNFGANPPKKVLDGAEMVADCFEGEGSVNLRCDKTELQIVAVDGSVTPIGFEAVAAVCGLDTATDFQCVLDAGPGVKIYASPSGEDRPPKSHVHRGDRFVYTCETGNHVLENAFDGTDNGQRSSYIEAECTEGGIMSGGNKVLDGVTCALAQYVCLLTALPRELEATLPNENVKTFLDEDQIDAVCSGAGDWYPFRLRCEHGEWKVFLNGFEVEEPLSHLCENVRDSCDLGRLSSIVHLGLNQVPRVMQGEHVTAQCFGNNNVLSFLCHKGAFEIDTSSQTTVPATFEAVSERCGLLLSAGSICILSFGTGVVAYSKPSNEQRSNGTSAHFGDNFIYTCGQEGYVLSDILDDGSILGFARIECLSDGLKTGGRAVQNTTQCQQATGSSFCLARNLPTGANFEAPEDVSTFISGDHFAARCSGMADWLHFEMRCEDGVWEAVRDGEVVTESLEDLCTRARNGCDARKVNFLAVMDDSNVERVLNDVEVTGRCHLSNKNIAFRCVEEDFELTFENFTTVRTYFNAVVEFCGYRSGSKAVTGFYKLDIRSKFYFFKHISKYFF
ncbi:hypothetical protein MHBO_001889 [Bonamia ostreae]|uniref:Cation-independent mannose-6-phosphate receptor n=1 Tax=Bonamia ostreae TaxID=126728 RepID=A0ABV2AKK3_9EUKA